MSILSDKVREIINMHDSMNSKVRISVSSIDKEIINVDKDIESLTNNYVQREMAGDTNSLSKIMDSINGALQEKSKLKFKKEAYEKATVNSKELQDALSQVLDIARETQKQRFIDIDENRKKERQLRDDIRELELQVKKMDSLINNQELQSEARQLRRLLPYIEKRNIKPREEETYLQLLINCGAGANIESLIQETKHYEKPDPTSIMSEARYR